MQSYATDLLILVELEIQDEDIRVLDLTYQIFGVQVPDRNRNEKLICYHR